MMTMHLIGDIEHVTVRDPALHGIVVEHERGAWPRSTRASFKPGHCRHVARVQPLAAEGAR
jgi:hypothetical protein